MPKVLTLAEFVEEAAKARNDPVVARKYIHLALARIKAKLEDVDRYPSGKPTLKAAYQVAARLEGQAATKN